VNVTKFTHAEDLDPKPNKEEITFKGPKRRVPNGPRRTISCYGGAEPPEHNFQNYGLLIPDECIQKATDMQTTTTPDWYFKFFERYVKPKEIMPVFTTEIPIMIQFIDMPNKRISIDIIDQSTQRRWTEVVKEATANAIKALDFDTQQSWAKLFLNQKMGTITSGTSTSGYLYYPTDIKISEPAPDLDPKVADYLFGKSLQERIDEEEAAKCLGQEVPQLSPFGNNG
jgi:hypothetical protein